MNPIHYFVEPQVGLPTHRRSLVRPSSRLVRRPSRRLHLLEQLALPNCRFGPLATARPIRTELWELRVLRPNHRFHRLPEPLPSHLVTQELEE